MIKLLIPEQYFKNANTSDYFPGINAVKGFLIILVIITHSIPHGMFLYFNYFFHMPVFLAISGFLLKESAFRNGMRHFLRRILHRMIIPWILALIGYLPFRLAEDNIANLNLSHFIYPYYHLWYIPAYILGVSLCYLVTRFKLPTIPVLLLTALITGIWFIIFKENKLPFHEQPLYYLGDKRIYAYLFFFFLGFCLRNKLIRIRPPFGILLGLIIFASMTTLAIFYLQLPYPFTLMPYMVLNISMILFIVIYIGPREWFQNKLLLLINKYSLGLYLYHPMIIFLIYTFIGDEKREHTSNWAGLLIGLLTIPFTLSLIFLLQKWSFTNRLFLGIIKDPRVNLKL